MAKEARIGEMRTRVYISAIVEAGTDADGFPTEIVTPLFGGPVHCLWVSAHGNEVYENMRLGLKKTATLTMRYSPLVDERCRLWREGDPQTDEYAYEIVSIDNVQDRRKLMEIKVKKVEKA